MVTNQSDEEVIEGQSDGGSKGGSDGRSDGGKVESQNEMIKKWRNGMMER